MMIGVLCFELMPGQMLHVFSHDAEVIRIGKVAFRIIAVSFIPLVTSLTFPVFFQAVGKAFTSSMLTVIRTVLSISTISRLRTQTRRESTQSTLQLQTVQP